MVLTESNTVGPLAGAYDYKISIVTPLGETLPGTTAAFGVTPDVAAAPGAISDDGKLERHRAALWRLVYVGNDLRECLRRNLEGHDDEPHADDARGAHDLESRETTGGALTLLGVYKWHVHVRLRVRRNDREQLNRDGHAHGFVECDDSGQSRDAPERPARHDRPADLSHPERRHPSSSSWRTIANNTARRTRMAWQTSISGERMPDLNTFGGYDVTVTGIDTGPTGTTARRIYRTKKDGSVYYLVGRAPEQHDDDLRR